ncbi:MAG: hypothetical protein AAGA30_08045 [Planctomycetota bacterium]
MKTLISPHIGVWVLLFAATHLSANEAYFDCPSNVSAQTLEFKSREKLVEIQIPISAKVLNRNWKPTDLIVEITWSGDAFSVRDYFPKTTIQSNYEGTIDVESKRQTNFKVGAKVGSDSLDFISPSLNAEVNRSNAKNLHYKEIPEHEQVISSGSMNRGTGVYFQFRPSRTEKLDGGRTLNAIYSVPMGWRGGVLEVTFTLKAKVKKFAGLTDEVQFARRFMMPVYLSGDDQARAVTEFYSRTEQKLRNDWYRLESQALSDTNDSSWFSVRKVESNDLWMHQLIQTGNADVLKKYGRQIPKPIHKVAVDLVSARRQLSELSR